VLYCWSGEPAYMSCRRCGSEHQLLLP
jgi:hypothetical protein